MKKAKDIAVRLKKDVKVISDNLGCDLLLYYGSIEPGCEKRVYKQIAEFKSESNLALFLTTPGGYPDVAYQIARCIHRNYEKFYVFVGSYCKSAGTLISVGSDEMVLADLAQLGPLDIQIAKHDELAEWISGLTPVQALATLRSETFKTFEEYFVNIVEKSFGQITAMRAAQHATRLTTQCFAPIYKQIDPMRLGEYERAMDVMYHYGQRLDRGNLQKDALIRLITDYPSHGFVIDREESEQLFKMVRAPSTQEQELLTLLPGLTSAIQEMSGKPVIEFLGPRSRILQDAKKGGGDNAPKDHNPKGSKSKSSAGVPRPDVKDPPGSRGAEFHPTRPETADGEKPVPRRGGRRVGRNGNTPAS